MNNRKEVLLSLSVQNYIGEQVELGLFGGRRYIGILVDTGLDILVLFDGYKFIYFPIIHLQYLKASSPDEEVIEKPSESAPFNDNNEQISYRKILNNAKGLFVEIFVCGNQSIHGYITSILNDYFVFYSPIYKTVFISLNHLKWLIPYTENKAPYLLDGKQLPVHPTKFPLSRTFDEQLKKMEEQIVVLDLGDTPNKAGVIKKINNNLIELISANGEKIYWRLHHIKTVHLP